MIDLNEPPTDEAEDASVTNPEFCTQVVVPDQEDPCISEVRLSLEETHIAEQHEAEQIDVFPTGVVRGYVDISGHVAVAEGGVDQVQIAANEADENVGGSILSKQECEVWSSPECPYTGKIFSSLEEAKTFYNNYAKRVGFSIRTNTSRRSAINGELEKVQFVCNKEGKGKKIKEENSVGGVLDDSDSDEEQVLIEYYVQEKESKSKKRKRETMKYTQCKARMVVKLIGARWHVIFFIGEHNHELVTKPSLTKFLRSHKEIPAEENKFIKLLHGCNIQTGRIMQLMTEFYGSRQLVPYESKDVHNFRATLRTVERYRDMEETLNYFQRLKQADPNFFYKFKLDEQFRVESLFWLDGNARKAYAAAYHDFVSFDATYMTNMYAMPFCPFIGINKHGQSFQLGCAFIRDEKAASYIWVFEMFLEAMNGVAPLNIITDQDGAMRIAIERVIPNSIHRNCRWHIMNKAAGTVGPSLARDPNLKEAFENCINYSVTPEEFEETWSAMISTYHLEGNKHFQHLYGLRRSFIPAYYMHNFYPFLQSTQRSEGYNGVLKLYGNPSFSILDFVKQYEKIQEKCLVDLDGQDFRTDDKKRVTWSKNPIEKHAVSVYTKNIFYKFSQEYQKTEQYYVKSEADYQYKLVPNDNFVPGYGSRTYLVTAIEEDETFYCECSMFDRDGIICCHIMKIMSRFGMRKLPERYILKRWTPKAIPNETIANPAGQVKNVGQGMPVQNKRTMRYTNLLAELGKIALEGSKSEAANAIVTKHIGMLKSEFQGLRISSRNATTAAAATTAAVASTAAAAIGAENPHNSPLASDAPANQVGNTENASTYGVNADVLSNSNMHDASIPGSSHLIRNPPKSACKGRKKSKRLSNGMNAQPKRKKTCSVCGSNDHTAPSCQKKRDNTCSSKEPQMQNVTN